MKIKVYIKQPGRVPYSTNIENSLENLQKSVDGHIDTVTFGTDFVIICKNLQKSVDGRIESVTFGTDFVIICNEDGRLVDLPYNCTVCGIHFVGTIIFAGVKQEEFSDVPIDFKSFKKRFRFLWE